MQWHDLSLRVRRGTAEPEIRDGRLVFQGESEWLLTGPPDQLNEVGRALAGLAERIGEQVMLLQFGNAVGMFDLPHLGRVEVVSGKWEARHFDQMLADLTRMASALPFAGEVAAALPYDRSVVAREDVLYHAFVYLRHIVLGTGSAEERLLPALGVILAAPHRRLERIRRPVSVDAAGRVDAAGLSRLTTGRGGLVRPGDGSVGTTLARRLRGYLPEQVDEVATTVSVDTPENRFVKAFLGSALGLVEGLQRVVREPPATGVFGARIRADCDAVARALRPVARDPLWRDVGPMTQLPAGSTVLQRRRGYQEVFRHFARLRLAARVPLTWEQVRDLLEAKDIAQLYELWCYFALVETATARLGAPVSAGQPVVGPLAVGVPWELAVAWLDGTRLLYNPRFSRSRRAIGRGSYSVPLRPDIALEVHRGVNAGLHLFDAKFKVERIEAMLGSDQSDESIDVVEGERQGTFKRGDLYKMHAYRDAIGQARSVWVLYPGSKLLFYAAGGEVADDAADLPRTLAGVGAVALAPASERAALATVLGRLLDQEVLAVSGSVGGTLTTPAAP